MKGYDVLRLYRWSLPEPFRQLYYGFRGVSFEDQVPSKDEPVFYPRDLSEPLSSIPLENWISSPAILYAGICGALAHDVGRVVGIPFRPNELLGKLRRGKNR